MGLSRDAVLLLRWLRKMDRWLYIETIEKNYKKYEYRSFLALKEAGLIEAEVFDYDYENPMYDEDWGECYREHYRISDTGKAHLESLSAKRWPEFRAWVTLVISVLALIVSVIALVLG